MASITRLKDGKFRCFIEFQHQGERMRRSSTIPNSCKKEAQKLASEMERTAKLAAGMPCHNLTREWWEGQADNMMRMIGKEPVFVTSETFGRMFDRWLDGKKKASQPTMDAYRTQKKWLAEDEGLMSSPIRSIKHQDIANILAKYGVGRSRATAQGLKTTLNGVFKVAIGMDLIDKNPVHGIKLNDIEKGGFDRLPFTFADVTKLRSFMEGDLGKTEVMFGRVQITPEELREWRIMMEAALRGALRISDTALIHSDQLEEQDGILWLSYKAGKTGSDVALVCSDAFRELVRGVNGLICPNLSKIAQKGRWGLSNRWLQIQDASGVECPMEKVASGKTVRKKSFHSFRHTAPSWMLAAGIPKDFVRKVTGHATDKILDKHYVHLVRESMIENKEKLDAFEKNHFKKA